MKMQLNNQASRHKFYWNKSTWSKNFETKNQEPNFTQRKGHDQELKHIKTREPETRKLPENEFGEEREEDEEGKNEQRSRGEGDAALAKFTEGGGAPSFLPEPVRKAREAQGPRALLRPRESGEEEDERIAVDAISERDWERERLCVLGVDTTLS